MKLLEEHTVPEGLEKARLSDYCIGLFQSIPSRKGIKKALAKNRIWLDGRVGKSGDWVTPGIKIELFAAANTPAQNFHFDVPIIYEDDWIAVVNKPPGLSVSGNQFQTLQNALPNNLKPSSAIDQLPHPLPVHRLDRPTSGLLLIAKTRTARIALGQALEDREIHKEYRALVSGLPPEEGIIELPIDGKKAHTAYHQLDAFPSLSYGHISHLSVQIETGRTHQIRKHLSAIGHPIIGDAEYGTEGKILKGKGLFLCACRLRLMHPIHGEELNIEVDPPRKFEKLRNQQIKNWENRKNLGT